MAGSKRRRKQVDATPRKEGRVSARLQSLYSPTDQPQTPVVDFVRAGMPFKARKWVKAAKRVGGEGPQGFSIPRWAPVGVPAGAHRSAPGTRGAVGIRISRERRNVPFRLTCLNS